MSILVKHFVNNPRVVLAINDLTLSEEEKVKLTETVVLLYHQKLLSKFLEKLVEEDKRLLMEKLLQESATDVINLLREKIIDIEGVVNEAILELDDQILNDLAVVKGNK